MPEIESFELTSYGNVKLKHRGGGEYETTREYYCVPASVIKKLVGASSPPDLKDFDKWLEDARPKDSLNPVSPSTFWDRK